MCEPTSITHFEYLFVIVTCLCKRDKSFVGMNGRANNGFPIQRNRCDKTNVFVSVIISVSRNVYKFVSFSFDFAPNSQHMFDI